MNKVSARNRTGFAQIKHLSGLFGAISLAILVGFGQPAEAQEVAQSHLIAAKNAITATKATVKLNEILPTAAGRLAEQMIGTRPDIASSISDFINETALELAPRRGDLEKEITKIYARIFSEDELLDIAAFFSTEAGQKFQKEFPLVIREVERASQIWGTGINRDLAQKTREKLKAANLD